jgi:S1-C subfamily serine protease
MGREMTRQVIIAARPDGGLQVKRVQPGSAFERMGLRAGDLLQSVNGNPVNSGEELARLYQQINDGSGEMNVGVLRDGKPEELRFVKN